MLNIIVLIIFVYIVVRANPSKKQTFKKVVIQPNERSQKVQAYYAKHPEQDPLNRMSDNSEATEMSAEQVVAAIKTDVERIIKEPHVNSEGLRCSLEDRENDWLARQKREEEMIARRSDMFTLKMQHAADCDAEELRKVSRKRKRNF